MIRRATKTDALLAHIRGLGTDKYGAPVGIRTTALAEATGVGTNSIQVLLDPAVLRGDLVVCKITGPTGRIEREYRAGPGVPPPAFVPLNTRRAGIAHGPATKPLPVTTAAASLSTSAPAANAAPAVPVFLDQQREKPQPAVGNTGSRRVRPTPLAPVPAVAATPPKPAPERRGIGPAPAMASAGNESDRLLLSISQDGELQVGYGDDPARWGFHQHQVLALGDFLHATQEVWRP